MNTFFKELFDYNNFCNQEFLQLMIKDPVAVSERSMQLLSHAVNVHHLWNCEIDQSTPFYTAWVCRPPAELKKDNRKNYFDSLLIIDQYNLDKTVTHTTSNGAAFTSSIRDILFHIINHSTYHRAQVSIEIKQMGMEPPATDYIYFKMKNNQIVYGNKLQA